MTPTVLIDVDTLTDAEIQRRWEEAYVRFETPEEEIQKFIGRLNKLGQAVWDRDAAVVDIFCGRGNGLKALESLGFTNLAGVDISAELLARYEGPAKMYEADCRKLPFESGTKDIVIVQGGLHHLPDLPDDLKLTLSEVHRVLKPGGKFVMVEPWRTPFLRAVHFISEIVLVRTVSSKFDAFATMTHYEARTYFNWLSREAEILELLHNSFDIVKCSRKWGKLNVIAKA